MHIRQIAKNMVKRFSIILLNIGFDPRRTISLRHYPKYLSHNQRFKKLGGVVTHSAPVFIDFDAQAGSASGHYFHQDLLVASFVYNKKELVPGI